jgi:hypothetical protein
MRATDPAAWQPQFDELTAGSVPVLETTLRPCLGTRMPVARVDARERPDLRDMLRLLKQEREGSQCGGWGVATDGERVWLVLSADIERPARCSFRLVFPYDRHRGFLEACARSRVLAVAVEPLRYRDGLMTTPCIGLTYSGDDLGMMLAAVDLGLRMRAALGRQGARP